MTQLKSKFINYETNENTSSLCGSTSNIYQSQCDEYRECEPERLTTEECTTPKFETVDVNGKKIHIKIQKDRNSQNIRNISKKKNNSFINNIVKKMEDMYVSRLHNKKNNKLLYESRSMMLPNEYLNVEPTNNVLYRRRTPNETLLRSDFNGVNLKPFVRFKSVGNLDNRMKNKAIIKISNLNPYGRYNNMEPNYFSPTCMNTPKYINDFNLKENERYKNTRNISNDFNYSNNRTNIKTLPNNTQGARIRRNTVYYPFYGNNTKNIKYNEPYLNNCKSYNLHDLKNSHNVKKKNNRISLKLRSRKGNKEEYLYNDSHEVNNNRIQFCDNMSNSDKEIVREKDFLNQKKKLNTRISMPLYNYSNHLEENEENAHNPNYSKDNFMKIRQNASGIKLSYAENNMNNAFPQNNNNCRSINDCNSNNQYQHKNFSSDKKNSQIVCNENNTRASDHSMRKNVNLKYEYDDKNSSYNINNKNNRNSLIHLKEKRKNLSKSSLIENENLNSDEEKTILNASKTHGKVGNNSFDKSEKSFNQSNSNILYRTSSNSREQLESDSYDTNHNMNNCKINKSCLQIEDKGRSKLLNSDNSISDMKIIKKSFSNQTKSSNEKIVLYDVNRNKYNKIQNGIDYKIIKDNNSKEDNENYLSKRGYLKDKSYIDNNCQDSLICDNLLNSKEKYGNLKTMTIVSDNGMLHKEEAKKKGKSAKNMNQNSRKYSFHKKFKSNDSEYNLNSNKSNSENWEIVEYNKNDEYKSSDTNNNINNYKKYKLRRVSMKNKRNLDNSKRTKSNKVHSNGLLEIEDKKRSRMNSFKNENGYNNSNEIINYKSKKSKTKSSVINPSNKAITLKNKESSTNKSDYDEDDGNYSNSEIDKKHIYTKKNSKNSTYLKEIKKNKSERSKSEHPYDFKAIKDISKYYSSGSSTRISEEKNHVSNHNYLTSSSISLEKKQSYIQKRSNRESKLNSINESYKKSSNESLHGCSVYSSKNRANTMYTSKNHKDTGSKGSRIIDEQHKKNSTYLKNIKKNNTCSSCEDYSEKEKKNISLENSSRRKKKGTNNSYYSNNSVKRENLEYSKGEHSHILTDEDYEKIRKSKNTNSERKSNRTPSIYLKKSKNGSNMRNMEEKYNLYPEEKLQTKKPSIKTKRSYVTNDEGSNFNYYSKLSKMNPKYSHYSENKCSKKKSEKNNEESGYEYDSQSNADSMNDFEIKSKNRKSFQNLSKHNYIRKDSKQKKVESYDFEENNDTLKKKISSSKISHGNTKFKKNVNDSKHNSEEHNGSSYDIYRSNMSKIDNSSIKSKSTASKFSQYKKNNIESDIYHSKNSMNERKNNSLDKECFYENEKEYDKKNGEKSKSKIRTNNSDSYKGKQFEVNNEDSIYLIDRKKYSHNTLNENLSKRNSSHRNSVLSRYSQNNFNINEMNNSSDGRYKLNKNLSDASEISINLKKPTIIKSDNNNNSTQDSLYNSLDRRYSGIKELNDENITEQNLDDTHKNICKHSLVGSKHSSEKIIKTYSFNDSNHSARLKNSSKNTNKDYITDEISSNLNNHSIYSNEKENIMTYNNCNSSYVEGNSIKEKECSNNEFKHNKTNNSYSSELYNENDDNVRAKESAINNNIYINTYETYRYNTMNKRDSFKNEKLQSSKIPYAHQDEDIYNERIYFSKLKNKSKETYEPIRSKNKYNNSSNKILPYLRGSKELCDFINNTENEQYNSTSDDKNMSHEKEFSNTKNEYAYIKNINQSLTSFPEDGYSLKNIKKSYINNEDYYNDVNTTLYRENKKINDPYYEMNNNIKEKMSFHNRKNESSINLSNQKNAIDPTYINNKKYMKEGELPRKSNLLSADDLDFRNSKINRNCEDIDTKCMENFSYPSNSNRNIIENNKSYRSGNYNDAYVPSKTLIGKCNQQKNMKYHVSPNHTNYRKEESRKKNLYSGFEYTKINNSLLHQYNQCSSRNNKEIEENDSLLNRSKKSMNLKSRETLENIYSKKKESDRLNSEYYYNENNLNKNHKSRSKDKTSDSLNNYNKSYDDRNFKRESNCMNPSNASRKQDDEEKLQKIGRTISHMNTTDASKRENRKMKNQFTNDYNSMSNLNNNYNYNNFSKNYSCHNSGNNSISKKNEPSHDNVPSFDISKRSKSYNLPMSKNSYIKNVMIENNNSLNGFKVPEDRNRSNKYYGSITTTNKKEISDLNDKYNNGKISKNNNEKESVTNSKSLSSKRFLSENYKKKKNEIINSAWMSDESVYSKSESERNFNLFYVEKLSHKKGLQALLPKIIDTKKKKKSMHDKKKPESDDKNKISSHNRNDHLNYRYNSGKNIKNHDINEKTYEDNNSCISSYISNGNKKKLINMHSDHNIIENSELQENTNMSNQNGIYDNKMNQTIEYYDNNSLKDSENIHVKKNNNSSEKDMNYSRNYTNGKNTNRTRISRENNTFEKENINNSKYNRSFNASVNNTRSRIIKSENGNSINNNVNSLQIENNNQMKTSMNDYSNRPITEHDYNGNSKSSEKKISRRESEGLNAHVSNSNRKSIYSNEEYINKENENLANSLYSYKKKSEHNNGINSDVANINSLNMLSSNFNSKEATSKGTNYNNDAYSYDDINKGKLTKSISLNDNTLSEIKKENNEQSLNKNSNSYEIGEKTRPNKNYTLLSNDENSGIRYVNSNKSNLLNSDVSEIIENNNPSQVMNYQENAYVESVNGSNRNKQNSVISQVRNKNSVNLNASEIQELTNLNNENSIKRNVNSRSHYLDSINNDNNKNSHRNSLNVVVGLDKANEYMKSQLTYYLENDNEINKNSSRNYKNIEPNINFVKNNEVYNNNIENSGIPSTSQNGIHDLKSSTYNNINSDKKNISFLFEESSKGSTNNLNQINNISNNNKIVNKPYSSLTNSKGINSHSSLNNLTNNNSINYENETNNINNNINIPIDYRNNTYNKPIVPNSIPINNSVSSINSIPVHSSILINNGIPINNSVSSINSIPIHSGIPINNSIPVHNSVPISNNIPANNCVPINNGIPINNIIPINNSIPISHIIPINNSITSNNNISANNNMPVSTSAYSNRIAPTDISMMNSEIGNSFCLNGGGNVIKCIHSNEKKKNNFNNSSLRILGNDQLNKNNNISVFDNLHKNGETYINNLVNKNYSNNNLINKNITYGSMINQKSIISQPTSTSNLNDQNRINNSLINNNGLSRMYYDNKEFSTINPDNQNLNDNLVNPSLKNNDINSILMNRDMSHKSAIDISTINNSSSCNNFSHNFYRNYSVQNNLDKQNSVNCNFTNLNNNVSNQSLYCNSSGKEFIINGNSMNNNLINNRNNYVLANNHSLSNISNNNLTKNQGMNHISNTNLDNNNIMNNMNNRNLTIL